MRRVDSASMLVACQGVPKHHKIRRNPTKEGKLITHATALRYSLHPLCIVHAMSV